MVLPSGRSTSIFSGIFLVNRYRVAPLAAAEAAVPVVNPCLSFSLIVHLSSLINVSSEDCRYAFYFNSVRNIFPLFTA
jgi:hypothetical protein